MLMAILSSNPFKQYIDDVTKNKKTYSKEIVQMVAIQKKMLKKYDFIEDKGKKCVDWIEKFCILTEGERAGQRVKLLLWQKWFIYSILCFYGYLDIEEFDEDGNFLGINKKYVRIVNDVLLVVGSGNAKTTLLGFIIAYFMFSNELPACKIFIGSNAYKQSRLCFDTTMNILHRNQILRKNTTFRSSAGEIEVVRNASKLTAMSSDGKNFEGIIPALLVIDEIHEMKTSEYAENLRKSTKRSDALIIEMTTNGTVRGGYLDSRMELAHNILSGESEVENYRKFFAIYKQDSEDEVFNAYRKGDIKLFRKSNPSLGIAVSVELLKEKVSDMINDPSCKPTVLTKNFNIPQNPITSYFTEKECRAREFDESIFMGAPVFLGLDMAYTRNPDNDLACLEMLMINPYTGDEYCKDFYFLPKYWQEEHKENGKLTTELKDMLKEKSKVDTNILYNKRQKKYGYQLYAQKGDVVVIDEELIETLVSEFGEGARSDCTGVTEDFIFYYLAHLELTYKWTICKFGLDPNKASKIEAVCNQSIPSIDGKPPVIKFRMEDKRTSQPIIQSTKEVRSRGLVFNNNKLTELHFAAVQAKEDKYGNVTFTNPRQSRKDGVIANLAARSAFNVFVNNKDTGARNLELLKEWWDANMAKDILDNEVEEVKETDL